MVILYTSHILYTRESTVSSFSKILFWVLLFWDGILLYIAQGGLELSSCLSLRSAGFRGHVSPNWAGLFSSLLSSGTPTKLQTDNVQLLWTHLIISFVFVLPAPPLYSCPLHCKQFNYYSKIQQFLSSVSHRWQNTGLNQVWNWQKSKFKTVYQRLRKKS